MTNMVDVSQRCGRQSITSSIFHTKYILPATLGPHTPHNPPSLRTPATILHCRRYPPSHSDRERDVMECFRTFDGAHRQGRTRTGCARGEHSSTRAGRHHSTSLEEYCSRNEKNKFFSTLQTSHSDYTIVEGGEVVPLQQVQCENGTMGTYPSLARWAILSGEGGAISTSSSL